MAINKDDVAQITRAIRDAGDPESAARSRLQEIDEMHDGTPEERLAERHLAELMAEQDRRIEAREDRMFQKEDSAALERRAEKRLAAREAGRDPDDVDDDEDAVVGVDAEGNMTWVQSTGDVVDEDDDEAFADDADDLAGRVVELEEELEVVAPAERDDLKQRLGELRNRRTVAVVAARQQELVEEERERAAERKAELVDLDTGMDF